MTQHQIGRLADTLRRTIHAGRVITTGPDYDAGRAIWNGAVLARPGVIVRCGDHTGDHIEVQVAVRAAREAGVPLSVRGGGHDWAGRSLSDGGLTIDLSGMRQVTVDPEAKVAEVAGGATAADVVRAAQPFGLTAATGSAGSRSAPPPCPRCSRASTRSSPSAGTSRSARVPYRPFRRAYARC
ncbi:FAD-dependent oxidoreductase [Nonomuraea sp. NPDC004580]|uniref:FAD-binding oxidoreductase n=1 Tax=Nonomuraea sp. NPDC004580 TaxID=3154552 RepID=UPI0033B4EF82